jgi:two-component system, OmpR family, sensor histidine kinase KdpD
MARKGRLRAVPLVSLEAIAAIGLATGTVALLEGVAPVTGLGVVYLLAVLFVASRHGEIAALATAVGSVLTLNFFFIEPRHRLTISDSRNVAALGVFLIAGIVVSRLAAAARQRANESELRAHEAAARERESSLLAGVASSLLAEGPVEAQLSSPGGRLAHTVARAGLRIELAPAPAPHEGEKTVPLELRSRRGWLYAKPDSGWQREELDRVAEPLARLVDVAIDREEVAERTAEAEAAQRADVAKTAVLHAISHDLRSPLTAITTATGALSSGPLSDDDRRELLAVLRSESTRLARLVDDLLDLSRIEAGAVNPRPDWCDLHDTVASAAEHVRREHPEHDVELIVPADLPLVRADPAQIERVFSNLIENAAKFSPAGTPVRVSASVAGERVTVRVTDEGRGIPPTARAHVFEPFFRGRAAKPGSGLGLTICKGFVEANGGRIQLDSRPGVGTSFAVSFRLVPQPAAPA